jgi:hypothetical protein
LLANAHVRRALTGVLGGVAVAVVLPSAGCGGGSSGSGSGLPDPGPASGLSRSERLTSLTPMQRTQLCDWSAGRFGGWGVTKTCANGNTVSSAQSESTCTYQLSNAGPSCTATVGNVEDCIDGAVPSCSAVPLACLEFLIPCGM